MTITRCRACLAWSPHNGSTRDADDHEAMGTCFRWAPRPVADGLLPGIRGEVHFSSPMRMNNEGCCEGIPDPWVWP